MTNGGTGDGYYVRAVLRATPKVVKVAEPPKYQSIYQPNVSYWDLLGRKQDKAKNQMTMNEVPIQNDQPQIYNKMPTMGNDQDIYANQLLYKADDASSYDNAGQMVNPEGLQFGTVTAEMSGSMGDFKFDNQN